MSTSKWTGAVSSDWNDADNWSPAGIPGVTSDVVIATGAPVASASIGTVNSITDSFLGFRSAGTNTVATFLDNTGRLYVDAKGGEGGTILNIGETLTNSGHLYLGNSTLSAPDTVTAASLDNTGSITLTGSSANQALLDVTGSAGFGTADVLSVQLARDSAIEFASGEITSLAANAQLHLYGSDAFIEDSKALGSNSALTGLASIGARAILGLHNKAAVSTTGALVNDGTIRLDIGDGDGGSSLTLAGALTNSHDLVIGNAKLSASDEVTAASLDNTGSIYLTGSSANQALLDVTDSAGFGTAEVLSGNVALAGDSAIEFASGEITSLAANAQLHLNGSDAVLEDSRALGSNSALTGLASIGAGATFDLENGASVTTGALANDATINLDTNAGGGSSLTLAGALTNSGALTIGNSSLSSSSKVSATALSNTGSINLTGSGAEQALLDVTGSAGFGAAGVLSGNVQLSGGSAIEFAGGEITSLAANAQLILTGNSAFIEDSRAPGSNSALTGLASIGAGATFDLENQAAVSTNGALANDGNIKIDDSNFDVGSSLTVAGALTNSGSILLDQGSHSGGSTLSVGGTLINSGSLTINPGRFEQLSAPCKVTAASIDNTGLINLIGNQTLLDVTTGVAGFGAAGILSGNVVLGPPSYTSEGAAIEFKGGQISTIATGATLSLTGAFIEDSTDLGSNSALTGLTDIAGSLYLEGASLSTTGSVTNSGLLVVDSHYSPGGSTLSIGGTLTNTGTLDIGEGFFPVPSSSVVAKSFDNSGTVNLTGNATYLPTFNVSGAITNNGSISIASDTEELAGAVSEAVGKTGSFSLSGANLHFVSSVSAGQTINESGADSLILDKAQNFAATIKGFGTGDRIDATNFGAPPATTYNFVENSGGTDGTLTLTDGSLAAHILMTGKSASGGETDRRAADARRREVSSRLRLRRTSPACRSRCRGRG
jgi:hypothetical protein